MNERHVMTETKKPGRMRRFFGATLKLAFPSIWISNWAEHKHKEIRNPVLAKLVEGFTYRKAYGFDELRGHVQEIRAISEQRNARQADAAHLTAEEAYRAMMTRHGFGEEDRVRGMKNLRRETRIAQVCMVVALACVMFGAYVQSWPTLVMALLALVYAWLKGTQASFFLWQSENRACLSVKTFCASGGLLKIFEW